VEPIGAPEPLNIHQLTFVDMREFHTALQALTATVSGLAADVVTLTQAHQTLSGGMAELAAHVGALEEAISLQAHTASPSDGDVIEVASSTASWH
jgi:hypothetical protein